MLEEINKYQDNLEKILDQQTENFESRVNRVIKEVD